MATYIELKRQAEELFRQAEALREAEKAEIVADIRAKVEAYGITAEDLGITGAGAVKKPVRTGARQGSGKVFKGPNGATWSGRGRQPKWIVEALAAGRQLEELQSA